jgi:hypothetical protein
MYRLPSAAVSTPMTHTGRSDASCGYQAGYSCELWGGFSFFITPYFIHIDTHHWIQSPTHVTLTVLPGPLMLNISDAHPTIFTVTVAGPLG